MNYQGLFTRRNKFKNALLLIAGVMILSTKGYSQGDDAIYRELIGSYRFGIDCFPLLRFDVLMKNSRLRFDAMGQNGFLTQRSFENFDFSSADYEGTVRFETATDGDVKILITVLGKTYQGTKKRFKNSYRYQRLTLEGAKLKKSEKTQFVTDYSPSATKTD